MFLQTCTVKEVDQLKVDIEKLKEENNIKENVLAEVHYKELEELSIINATLNNDIIDNLNQYETNLLLKDSELKKALENTEVTKVKDAKSISELRNEVNTLNLEMKRQL